MADSWKNKLLRGTLWSMLMRWSMKFLGLGSMIIVARLLSPEDYGIIAMAMLLIEFSDTLLNTSAEAALLRQPSRDRCYIDTAWTLRLLQSVLIAVLLIAVGPWAAEFFREPRLPDVLLWMSLGLVIAGLGNIGPVLERKDLNFGIEVRIAIQSKVASVLVNIGAALWLQSYWALILGGLAGHLISTVLSYTLHAYRPRFSLQRVGEMWNYSQWMLLSGIGMFVARRIDEAWAARISTPMQLGYYKNASEIGAMVSSEFSGPLIRALFPVVSSLQDQPAEMRKAVMQTIGVVNRFTLPASVGLACLAAPAVRVLLGEQWLGAATMLAIFSVVGGIRFLVSPYNVLFMAVGRSKVVAVAAWLEGLGFVAAAWPLVERMGPEGLALARGVGMSVAAVAWVVLGQRVGLMWRDLLTTLWRPLVATLCMAAVLLAMPLTDVSSGAIALRHLLVGTAIGASVYLIVTLLLWLASGRPSGPESKLLDLLSRRMQRAH